MPVTSPFGQFAPVIAVMTAVAVIGAWLIAILIGNQQAVNTLSPFAILSIGVIMGGATAVPAINGHVAAQASAANRRLDAMGSPAADSAITEALPHG